MSKEKCISCSKDTPVDKSTHIDYRRFYVEGAGQLCEECWNDIYDNSEEMLYYEE
jgi:hypothetical protein